MKSIVRIVLSVSLILAATTLIVAQEQTNYIPEGRYLVIGSFHIKANAEGFTAYVKKTTDYQVTMAYHPLDKFYYVYIKGYGPNETGFDDVKKMRQETEFIDSWYMVVKPYSIPGKEAAVAGKSPLQEVPEPPVATTNTEEQTPATENEQVSDNGWVKVGSPKSPHLSEQVATANPRIIPKTYNQQGKYKMYFNTYYVKNFKEVKGPVEVINPKTLKILRVVQSLELAMIPDPNNGEHAIQLIANIFGYKKVQHDIKLDEPLDSINAEFFHFKGDTLIADFPLRRYEVGDIATMYNVYFFKDAVIMKPISKYELNTLVDMLKENPKLKIRIHGHTNGNAAGKILLMPEGSDNYFSMKQDIVEERGSAKELSIQRAEIIKKYLMSFGISADRMEIKGWGGKKPLYDKMDKLAIKNVRVEIEILEN